VEVADWKQISLAFGKRCPCRCALALWAMPIAAGVVGDPPLAAVLAVLDVTAEGSSAAVLDADITFSCGRLRCPACARRYAAPAARKMSATSTEPRTAQPSGNISAGLNRPSLSSGLVTVCVSASVLIAP
jgi:hypothetical protein